MPEHDTHTRRVFTILFSDGVRAAVFSRWPESQSLTALVEGLVVGLNRVNEDDPEQEPLVISLQDCEFFSWDAEHLPVGTSVAQVPEPGVVFVYDTGAHKGRSVGGGLTRPLRQQLLRNETYGPRLRRFLRGPDATRAAAPLFRFDAFLSYAAQDGPLAARLVRELERSGVMCFLAEISLTAGRLWAEQLHQALLSSRAGVILLTPQSIHSDWVQVEVGAMWALQRPILPTLAGLASHDIPTSVRSLLPERIVDAGPTESIEGLVEALATQLVGILLEARGPEYSHGT